MVGNVWEWVNTPATPPQGAGFAPSEKLSADLTLTLAEPSSGSRRQSVYVPEQASAIHDGPSPPRPEARHQLPLRA
jgi:formylglycine-generating enzyme required for sulfatase activity